MDKYPARHLITSALLFLILALSGCGGGGGGGGGVTTTPTDPNLSFSLATLNSTTVGTVLTFQLTGSDSNGVNLTGSISLANRAQIMLGGVLVTPKDLILSITDGVTPVTVTGTSFVDTSGNLISFTIQTTGVTCAPVSPDTLPTSVKIGDFAIQSSLICNDNTTTERSWRVEDAGNGAIRIITSSTSKNQFNNVISLSDVTYTLDGGSNIVALEMVSTDTATNYTLNMNSI